MPLQTPSFDQFRKAPALAYSIVFMIALGLMYLQFKNNCNEMQKNCEKERQEFNKYREKSEAKILELAKLLAQKQTLDKINQ